MKTHFIGQLLLAGLGLLAAGAAAAETLVVNDELTVAPTDVVRPARGSTMQTVEAKFGAPQVRHDAIGKPAITRWDYPNFSVFFENQRVIHAVAAGQ
jgi:ribonucleotide monophosphatase NagD (HAD superfamily)